MKEEIEVRKTLEKTEACGRFSVSSLLYNYPISTPINIFFFSSVHVYSLTWLNFEKYAVSLNNVNISTLMTSFILKDYSRLNLQIYQCF